MRDEQEIEIAIVGSGFSGLAMADAAEALGPRRLRHLRARPRGRRDLAREHLPGVSLRRPSHVYSFSFAPNPDWSSTFSPQPEIRDYLRRVAAEEGLLEHVRFGCEVERASWDAERAALAPADLERPAARPRPDRRRRAAARAEAARHPGPARVRGHALPLGDLGPRPRARRRAGGGDRHRRERDPVRAPDPARGREAAPLPAHRAVGDAAPRPRRSPGSSVPPTGASRPCSGWRARRSTGRARRSRSRCCGSRWRRCCAWSARLTCAARSPDPRAAGEADARLPARLQADPGRERLPAVARAGRTSRSSPIGIAEVRGRSIVTADGSEREVDTIILGTGFHVLDLPIAERVTDGDGRSLAEHWDGSPRAHRGTMVAGFPNLFFLLGPNTGLGHNSVVYMAEAQADYVLQALAHLSAARAGDARGQSRGRAALERRDPGADGGHGVDRGRLLELVPRPQRAQHLALAGFQLPLRARPAALRPRRAPWRPRGRATPGRGQRVATGWRCVGTRAFVP